MTTKQLLILETTAGGGHQSISQAIVQSLHSKMPQIKTSRANILPSYLNKAYQILSLKLNPLYQLAYKATDNEKGTKTATKFNLAIQRKKLKQIITKHQPDIILSNTQIGIQEIPPILKELGLDIPFIVFIPDPFTPHSICFTDQADLTLLPTLTTYQIALSHQLSPYRLAITGHPTRQEFYHTPNNLKQHKTKLKLNPEHFTILFGGSGDGAEKTFEIIQYLIQKSSIFQQPLQALIVTGRNKGLKNKLEQLSYPQNMNVHIYGYIHNMANLVHASDLITGKAGPNIIFESVAANKPFLATYHIKGQEDGNLDFIRSTQIGFVEENPQKATHLIQTILTYPQILNHTKTSIKLVKEQHAQAASNIANEIIKHLSNKKCSYSISKNLQHIPLHLQKTQ